MAEKLLTVIIPAHNHGPYIAETLESVLSQGLDDLEILIVNDGSSDDTGEIADAYVRKFGGDKIVHMRREKSGPSAARNAGLARAKGRYVAFLDADDVWLPGTLSKRLDFLESHPDVALVSADVTNFSAEGVIDESYFRSRKVYESFKAANFELTDLFSFILNVCMVFTSTVVARKSVLREMGGFDESLHVGEDKELYFRLARRHKAKILPEVMLRRRIHGTNISSDEIVRRFSYVEIVEKIRRTDPEFYSENRDRLEDWLNKMREEGGYYLLQKGYPARAVREHAKTFWHRPRTKTLYYLGLSILACLIGNKNFARIKNYSQASSQSH